ncbi:hypothetical protein SLINC_2199 [Streptomyces lincolnensis]|uniref:Uncharacterized protein n=1 Tax=Streptomyces lincolnensis TaxID=1915 RepID=A0A1B1M7K3_STRLN|nr:hypothetical protein SLINC_2199 [Streptomyces lincolnensis]
MTTRVENTVNTCPPDFYARQSPAWSAHLSRFQPCTEAGREMNRAAWVEIRLG